MGGCKINADCEHWKDGTGDRVCYSCTDWNKQIKIHEPELSFTLDTEMLEQVQNNEDLKSVFEGLRNIKGRDRIIFEDFTFGFANISALSQEYDLSRTQIRRILWRCTHDVKLHLGLSTVF
jgi:hypothetical protein